jgi:hypothetical protein
MINFRFHVVSLIAIFLALALGVVIGAGVIDRGVVDALNNRLDRVQDRSNRIRDENDALSSRNKQLGSVVGDLQPFAASGALLDENVGIVAVRGVDSDQVSALLTGTQQAGATASGTLWLEDRWALKNGDDVAALQDALGTTTRNKNTLRAEGYQQLARRLSEPDASGEPDVLVTLQQAGFLGYDGISGSSIGSFPGRGAGIMLVVGNKGSVSPEEVTAPAASALQAARVPVVVAGVWADASDGTQRADAVKPIRDGDLARTVSTVDDLDLVEGPVTTVLAMSDLFLPTPVVGHYGYGPNTQVIPDQVKAST